MLDPDVGSARTPAQAVYRKATLRRVKYRIKKLFIALYETENQDANLAEALYRACATKSDEEPLVALAQFDTTLFRPDNGPALDFLAEIHAQDLVNAKITTNKPRLLSRTQHKELDGLADVLGAVDSLLSYIREEYPQEFYGKRKRLTQDNPGPKVPKSDYRSILLKDLFQEARVAIILGWPNEELTKNRIKRVSSVWTAYCQLHEERKISPTMMRKKVVHLVYERASENAPSVFKDQRKEATRLAFVEKALDDFFGRLEQPWYGSNESVDATDAAYEQEGVAFTQELFDRMYTLVQVLDADPNLSRSLKAFLAHQRGHANTYTLAERDQGKAEFWDLYLNAPLTQTNH